MLQWRIYTECKNIDGLIALTTMAFPEEGATFYEGRGLWQHKTEPSFVIEIVSPNNVESCTAVKRLAELIKEANKQQAVLVTSTYVTSTIY